MESDYLIPVKNHPSYLINKLGEVYSIRSNRFLKACVYSSGYGILTLNAKRYSLHRLVALQFLPNPNNFEVINHKNNNKLDNKVSNLEWCTQAHNLREALRTGARSFKRKFDGDERETIIILYDRGYSYSEINKLIKIEESTFYKLIKRGSLKTRLPK